MKLPSIEKPSWWKPWYKFQVINLAAVAINLGSLWLFWGHAGTVVNWFALGMSVTLFVSTGLTWKIMDDNRTLVMHNHMLADLLRSDVSKAISSHLENFGFDEPPPRPPLH